MLCSPVCAFRHLPPSPRHFQRPILPPLFFKQERTNPGREADLSKVILEVGAGADTHMSHNPSLNLNQESLELPGLSQVLSAEGTCTG